jgi:23S rRNA (adenine2503-C2)-methyltransferase
MKLQMATLQKKHALDLSHEDWKGWCKDENIPLYISDQILHWIFQKNTLNPTLFSNLSLPLRNKLADSFNWSEMEIDSRLISQDRSEKFLLKTRDGLLLEMVWMPWESRTTLCISSQVGCRMGCTFCQTGKMGFQRNLTAGEILMQIHMANRYSKVTNIVFMGMGEPLDNYDAVVKACRMMISPNGYALSKSKVTVSTSGLVPEIQKLGEDLPVRLAISLHQADNTKRSEIMPINKKYNLEDLKTVLLKYPSPPRYGITFEYVLIEGVNDAPADAKKLVKFLHGLKAKVNLIPINLFPGVNMRPSSAERIRNFQLYLTSRSIPAPVRYSRGQDISGGCGQLAAKRKEEIHLDPREVARKRRQLGKKQSTLL